LQHEADFDWPRRNGRSSAILRKLELERQVKGEELKQFDRDAAKLEA